MFHLKKQKTKTKKTQTKTKQNKIKTKTKQKPTLTKQKGRIQYLSPPTKICFQEVTFIEKLSIQFTFHSPHNSGR